MPNYANGGMADNIPLIDVPRMAFLINLRLFFFNYRKLGKAHQRTDHFTSGHDAMKVTQLREVQNKLCSNEAPSIVSINLPSE